jgi:hypothetical protein
LLLLSADVGSVSGMLPGQRFPAASTSSLGGKSIFLARII